MIAFVDDHRGDCGVGSICCALPIAPSSYYRHLAVRRAPETASKRARADVVACEDIRRVYADSGCRYGTRKVWHQLAREDKGIARCTVERLMNVMGLQGVARGKPVVTTNPDKAQPCPDDKVNRDFTAQSPNQLCPYGVCSQKPTG